MIKDEEQWKSSIREASLLPESPIQQKDGRWKVADRLSAWKAAGPRLFDDHLDRFRKVAVDALRERDPQFDIDADQRFAAGLYGKVLKHSHALRKGLAETLALLGNYPEYLTSCSYGKAEYTAQLAVREILREADWELWASLNDVLPLLAEAAPKEFLDAVENALISTPSPFAGVFAQEGSGFSGRIYITGLLWALEALAWDEQYLTRVVVILGGLADIDPGGKWSNRPDNSLVTILLPWFPQTLASVAKRRAAVTTLQAEFPDVAWRLLLKLLPHSQQSSSMTRKPVWRRIIPDDWKEGVTNQDYREQVTAYADLAISQAKQDRLKLATLINHFNNLPLPARENLLSYLGSEEVASWSLEERLPIWNELIELVSRHRKFANAKWAMTSDEVNGIAAIADRVEPESPAYKYRRLFTARDFDLYEETGNYVQQVEKLFERRKVAVQEVHSHGGAQAVLRFAEAVDSPGQVGFVFGSFAPAHEEGEILPALFESELGHATQFAGGFVLGRFRAQGWEWVDKLDMSRWSSDQKASLLAYLPFTSETWSRARQFLGDQEGIFWSKTHANPYDAGQELPEAVDKLLENHRIHAAIGVAEKIIYSNEPIDTQQVTRVLTALMQSPEQLRTMDPHAVAHLIKTLQEAPDTNQDELFKIEWAFLALLDGGFGVFPKLLQQALAQNSAFFCETIRLLYRSDKEEPSQNPSPNQQAVATNAYRLLNEWKTPPGSQDNGTFDGNALNSWLDEVKASCAASGHLKIAMQEIGKVLFYSPPDPDGLWIHRSVAAVLNAKDTGDIRHGYEIEIFNSRGVHFIDPEGKPERELANHYRKQAEEVEMQGYHRLATTLREAAASYDREAEQIAVRMRHEE